MRILSGVQPSGKPHLGNYFGAIQQHLQLQEEAGNECYYFIADYHALTTVHDPGLLRENVREIALASEHLVRSEDEVLGYLRAGHPSVEGLRAAQTRCRERLDRIPEDVRQELAASG